MTTGQALSCRSVSVGVGGDEAVDQLVKVAGLRQIPLCKLVGQLGLGQTFVALAGFGANTAGLVTLGLGLLALLLLGLLFALALRLLSLLLTLLLDLLRALDLLALRPLDLLGLLRRGVLEGIGLAGDPGADRLAVTALEVGEGLQLAAERLGDLAEGAEPLQGNVLVDLEPVLQVLELLAGRFGDVDLRQLPQLIGLLGERAGALLPHVGGPLDGGAGLLGNLGIRLGAGHDSPS